MYFLSNIFYRVYRYDNLIQNWSINPYVNNFVIIFGNMEIINSIKAAVMWIHFRTKTEFLILWIAKS